MSRAKLIVTACFAILAVGALMATTASAGEWDVGGTKLVGSEAIQSPAKVLEHGSLTVHVAGVVVECVSGELGIEGGEIVAPNEVRAKSLDFKECSVTKGECTLQEALIATLALHGFAELEGTLGTLVKVLPLPSKTFAVIHFLGAKCALLGFQPVTGTADLLAPSGKDPSVLQKVNAFTLPGGLHVGSDEALLVGLSGDVQLASGKTWSFL